MGESRRRGQWFGVSRRRHQRWRWETVVTPSPLRIRMWSWVSGVLVKVLRELNDADTYHGAITQNDIWFSCFNIIKYYVVIRRLMKIFLCYTCKRKQTIKRWLLKKIFVTQDPPLLHSHASPSSLPAQESWSQEDKTVFFLHLIKMAFARWHTWQPLLERIQGAQKENVIFSELQRGHTSLKWWVSFVTMKTSLVWALFWFTVTDTLHEFSKGKKGNTLPW